MHGGGTKRIINLICGLNPDRFGITLITGPDVDLNKLSQLKNCSVLNIRFLKRRLNPFYDLLSFIQLWSCLKKGRYHIVNTHHAKPGVLGRITAFLAKVPLIIHDVHGSTFGIDYPENISKLNRFLERILDWITSQYIFVGQDICNSYLENRIGRRGKMEVIHSGMDLEPFLVSRKNSSKSYLLKKELGVPQDSRIVGMVSRFIRGKGHEYAFEAMVQVLATCKDVKIVFVGDGPLEEKIRRRARVRGLGDSFIFTGYRNDVADIMGIFDVGIFTSLSEGLAQVLVQMAAAAVPLVTFDVSGAREVVIDKVNGFVVPVKDMRLLSERVKYLLDNPHIAEKMGARGPMIVSGSWSVEQLVNKTSDLYLRLMEKLDTSKVSA
jgi:glycosyltransferase involved in cell wall biosynthesis